MAVCSYSFSIRIASAQCCESPECEQAGGCEDLFIAVCVRQPNTTKMDRQTCSLFIAGNGSDIINRDLTPADIVKTNVGRYVLQFCCITIFFIQQLEPAGLTVINDAYQVSGCMHWESCATAI